MTKRLEDRELDAFLKRNQPVALAIDEAKLHASLLAKLGFARRTPTVRRPFQWMAFSGAMAAGLVAIFVVSRPVVQSNSLPTAAIEVVEADWDDEIYEEDLPAMDVGEDYLELMASNDLATGRISK